MKYTMLNMIKKKKKNIVPNIKRYIKENPFQMLMHTQ